MSRKAKAGLAIVVVLALAAGAWLVLDRPWTIDGYRVVDDRTIAVSVLSGPLYWTRVTSVQETSSTVRVTVTSFRPPAPGTGGSPTEFMVTLREPLAGRTVIDGSSDSPVPKKGSP